MSAMQTMFHRRKFLFLGLLFFVVTAGASTPAQAQDGGLLYVANYWSVNIWAYHIDRDTGRLTNAPGQPYGGVLLPTSIAADPTGQFVYVANWGYEGNPGHVSGHSIDLDTEIGALTAVPGSPFAAGRRPEGVAVDPTGRFVYVANGESIDIAAFSRDPDTGVLTPIAGSPFGTGGIHPTNIAVEPTGRFLYVVLWGSGAVRQFAINPDTGALRGEDLYGVGVRPSALVIDPTGRFLYVTAWESGIVSGYSINPDTGTLTPIPGSPFEPMMMMPRAMAVDPSGRFAYVAGGPPYGVSEFTINQDTGALRPISGYPWLLEGDPRTLGTDPSGRFLYVSNWTTYDIAGFSINQTTGALTNLWRHGAPTGSGPTSMVAVPWPTPGAARGGDQLCSSELPAIDDQH